MSRHQKFGLWALRLGLSATYLYSGTDLILNPKNWIGYLPDWFKGLLPVAPELYLKGQGIVELLFVLSFLTGFKTKWAALLSSLEILGILLFYGIDGGSFRDMAIFGAALALFFFYQDEIK